MNSKYFRSCTAFTLMLLSFLLLVTGCDRQEEKKQPVVAEVADQTEPLGIIVCA